MIFVSFVLTTFLVSLANGCFCPPLISPSCGCGGGGYNSYAGGGYGGGYSGGYSNGGYASSPGYATFYRDLTPFRQPYYQNQPQYYPQGPSRAPPPMYQLPNPRYIQPQAPPRPQPQYVARPAPQPYRPTLVQEKQVYTQPAAPVAQLAETHRATLHDNGYGEEVATTTYAPVATEAPAVVTEAPVTSTPVDEVPDFDETPVKKGEKEEFYYVYYDDKGNKVGDSRSGTTYAPENVIVEEETTVAPAPAPVHVEVTTERIETNENYDDIVEETQVPVRTSLAPSYTPEVVTSSTVIFMESKASSVAPSKNENAEVIYEDETVEYEDDGHHEATAPGPSTKKPQSGEFKRTVQDNQILVDAAENTGESYRSRSVVSGVRIVKRFRHDERKIHSN